MGKTKIETVDNVMFGLYVSGTEYMLTIMTTAGVTPSITLWISREEAEKISQKFNCSINKI